MAKEREPKEHKRHGKHQKHDKNFLRVYAPYLPLLVFSIIIMAFALAKPPANKTGVLSYATDITRTELLNQTNRQRLDNHDKKLSINTVLNAAAQAKAEDMAKRDYWSHNTPDGNQPWKFIDQTGYDYQKAGENLAYGFSDSSSTVAGWMNSPPHRENVLDNDFKDVGFGIANARNYQNNGQETIVVAFYGTPKGAQASGSSVQAVNTSRKVFSEPASRSIARIQTLTGGKAPWIVSAVSMLIGVALASLVIKHGLAFRKAFKKGEKFVHRHLLFDLTIISLIVLCIVITRTAGIVK